MPDPPTSTSSDPHTHYMRLAVDLARKSPPLPTNYCVGAVLVQHHPRTSTHTLLTTGYTNELPTNTHAEQVCLRKFALLHGVAEERLAEAFASLPDDAQVVLYTTMEPCVRRSPGNTPCVERVLGTRVTTGAGEKSGIGRVYVAVREPDVFVRGNHGRSVLEEHGVEVVMVEGFEEEAYRIAVAGHKREDVEVGGTGGGGGGD